MIEPVQQLKNVKKYEPPVKERKGKICLDFNENTIGPSKKVMEVLQRINPEDIFTYPDISLLKTNLARILNIKETELMITNGIDESILLLPLAYLNKGDEVILPIPTFIVYELYYTAIGASIVKVEYNKDMSFPTQKIIDAISEKTKVITLVSPNNPTGTVIPKVEIIQILEKAKKKNILVILDEAYWQYNNMYTLKDLTKQYDNLIVLQTFSKAYGLAGLRMGYAIASEEIISTLEKVKLPYVNSLGVIASLQALEDQEYVLGYLKDVQESKKQLYTALKEVGIKTYPTGANFFIAYFGEKIEYIYEEFKKRGILLRKVSNDSILNGCLRIGIGSKEQSRIFIENLKDILNNNYIK